jgi:hypothetical protein
MNRSASFISILSAALLLGCGAQEKASKTPHTMGDRVQVGPLVYTVLEADWENELGDGANARIPRNRFLVIRLSVQNAGSKELTLPLLTLEDDKRQETLELDNGQGLEDWLGLLRHVTPANTIQGRIVFDVPVAPYQLRLTDAADLEDERTAYVNIPLKLGSPVQ